MHYTALITGRLFAKLYGKQNALVIDIGGFDVNGSLRDGFQEIGMTYKCIDLCQHPSVDIVIQPGQKLPFADGSIDIIVSTSCFEHDPCFWLTFKEMTRVLKMDGYIYVNAPSNGAYHCHPGDNWRFYSDAGQALAYWASYQIANEPIYPVKVVETFHVLPLNDIWIDFVCVWKRVETKETEITISNQSRQNIGILEKNLNDNNVQTSKIIPTTIIVK
jgi:SAM-dependent methyltransferase